MRRRVASALRRACPTCVAMFLTVQPVAAHEFWLDPANFNPAVGQSVPISIRIGSDFAGDTYPYVRALDRGLAIVEENGSHKPKLLDGDDPAFEYRFTTPGLARVWHRRAPEPVVFDTFAKFYENLVEEGHEALATEHRRLGKPERKIRELFSRHAKALIAVGGKSGADRAVGLPLELIAETDVYDIAVARATIRLLYEGRPLPGILVKVFRGGKPITSERLRTDAEGRINFDVSNSGEYLVAAVQMLPAKPADKTDWLSLWASLTFARP